MYLKNAPARKLKRRQRALQRLTRQMDALGKDTTDAHRVEYKALNRRCATTGVTERQVRTKKWRGDKARFTR